LIGEVDVETEGDGEESGEEESDEQAVMDTTSAPITAIDTRCTAPKVAEPLKRTAEHHVRIVRSALPGWSALAKVSVDASTARRR
jgi:hypothetical protein